MTLPPPDSPDAPKYWMNEQGGELVPAIERYLAGESLNIRQIALMRLYLTQWIASPAWDMNPNMNERMANDLKLLRDSVLEIRSREAIDHWLKLAVAIGADPL